MSLWDSIGESINDGFGELIDAGVDRLAQEIAPEPASEVSQQPKTEAVNNHLGRNSDGTTVAQAVTQYPVQGQILSGVSNTKLALAGGAVVLLTMALFKIRGSR